VVRWPQCYIDEDHVRFETVVNELEQEKRVYETRQTELRTRAQKISAMEEQLRTMAELYPTGRIGTPEEAASVIAFLASSGAAWVTGSVYTVDGGLTA